MDIEEIRQDKRIAQESIRQISQEAEDKINAVLHQFEKRTGVRVANVEVRWVTVSTWSEPRDRKVVEEVRLDVPL